MRIHNTKVFLSSELAASRGYTVLPEAPTDLAPTISGNPALTWVSGITDLNGDLLPDFIVGSPGSDDKALDAGRVYVQASHLGDGTTGNLGDTTSLMIIDGLNAGDRAGAAVGAITDLNGDGKSELLIGAPGMEIGTKIDAGAGFVIWGAGQTASGQSTGVDLGDPFTGGGKGYVIKGEVAGDAAGTSMASIADLNGDGKSEVIIGAPGSNANGGDSGAAYVVFGKSTTSIVNLTSVTAGTGGYRIIGEAGQDNAGEAVASISDLNGDGKSEILIGASGSKAGGNHSGAVYVVFGKSSTTQVNLADVTAGIGGYRITGGLNDGIGWSVKSTGDINADGKSDILLAAQGSGKGSGELFVVFGKSDTTEVLISNVKVGIGGLQILGGGQDLSEASITGGQDFNHDGVADIVLGLPHDNEGGENAGAVYIIWGGITGAVDLSAIAAGNGGAKVVGLAGSLTGSSVAIVGDINLDGAPELLIGSPGVGESVRLLYASTLWTPQTEIYGTNGDDVIGAGYGGIHKVGDGNDIVVALAGNDTVSTGLGNDEIDGDAGNDTLDGGAGNDRLDGGTGNDLMIGGLGDDTFLVDSSLDTVQEASGEGVDTVISTVSITLAANVEKLELAVAGLTGTGNSLDNTLTGSNGNDTLNGGGGIDTLIGGLGNDTYVVDTTTDIISEAVGGGVDTVQSSVDISLAANVENLILTGAARLGTGNALNNSLIGTSGDDTLDGGAGSDSLAGGLGNDTYMVDSSGDQVIEALGAGTDTVIASVDHTLALNVENLVLSGSARVGTGNALNNSLTGTAGNDTLDGGLGADTMIGGLGDDTYKVDNAGDIVVELPGGGNDTVVAAFDYVLSPGDIENLTLTGAAHFGTGNAGVNTITGGAGNDTLDGGGGLDTLIGGAGDDVYVITNSGVTLIETVAGGTDTVVSAIDYVLANGSNIENLTLTGGAHSGTGNEGDNSLMGGSGADNLFGGLGNDTLNGGAGVDHLEGGDGNDTYYIDNIGDVVIESAAGGTDTVVVNSDWTLADNIENVTLVGTGHTLIGNAASNILKGDTGNDTLDGGLGDDTEQGGDGNDRLISTSGHDILAGGAGDDVYVIHGGSAHIEDFQGHDSIDASEAAGDSHIDLSGETQSEIENEICDFGTGGTITGALNVQFLQDLTGSFADDIANVRTLVPQIVSALNTVAGGAAFGVSTFRDKAFGSFGSAGDWVYQTQAAIGITPVNLTAAYASMVANGGADLPEAQLEALMQVGLRANTEVGFQSNAARFVVLFTDASYHTAADGLAAGLTTPNNGDTVLDGTPAGTGENYPEFSMLRTALEASNVIPIFAVAGGFEAVYTDLTTQIGRGTVVTLTANSSNIVAAITSGLTAATTTHIADATGGAGNDTLLGNVGDNTLNGGGGNDTLDGKFGTDHLNGGAGDDGLTGGAGADSLDGGSGIDTAIYTGLASEYRVTATVTGYLVEDLRAGTPDGVDTLVGVEKIQFSDSLVVLGGSDNPPVLSTPLVDQAATQNAAFTFAIPAGSFTDPDLGDVLSYTATLEDGSALPAWLAFDAVSQTFSGTPANGDVGGISVKVTATDLALASVSDVFVLTVANVNDAPVISGPAAGSATEDAVLTASGQLIASDPDVGATAAWSVSGPATSAYGSMSVSATGLWTYTLDNIAAQALTATDHVVETFTLQADDGLGGVASYSVSITVNGADEAPLIGTLGNDILVGTIGGEVISGLAGDDKLYGGDGNDVLNGGLGNDLLDGGNGQDTASYADATAAVKVNLGLAAAQLTGAGGKDTLVSIENVTGSAFNDTLTGNGLDNLIDGGSGNDKLNGGAGADHLIGGDGTDVLDGGLGGDLLEGGAGNDSYVVDDASDQVVETIGAGTDIVRTTLGSYGLTDNVENLTYTGGLNFTGSGNGLANILTGGVGNDVLSGLAGNDKLVGLAGDDTLIGGLGADSLTGGAGLDHFVFEAVSDSTLSLKDTIADFHGAEGDLVDLSQIDANSLAAGDQAFTLIGTAGFHHVAGELRYQVAGASLTVFGDTDGNGIADLAIKMTGLTSLTGAEFIF
jgi:VCBS repeat-containing protein